MSRPRQNLTGVAKAVSLVLWEADILSLGRVRKPDVEYDGEAIDIHELLRTATLDKQKTSEFLVRLFKKWGYERDDLKFRDWESLGDAIAWLYNHQDEWEIE